MNSLAYRFHVVGDELGVLVSIKDLTPEGHRLLGSGQL